MRISVLEGGLFTTIQDLGREGYQKYGVVVSGAMDSQAMQLANLAVGNAEQEAVLEITMIGPVLQLPKGSLIAITGADISPAIEGQTVPMGKAIYIQQDCTLTFGQCVRGCRAYFAVAGGFDIPSVMGSKSTYLRAKIGGLEGRTLQKGDVLPLGEKSEQSARIVKKLQGQGAAGVFAGSPWQVECPAADRAAETVIRVFEDQQTPYVTADSARAFFGTVFTVDAKSDRMGYRLNGPKLALNETIEMISGEVSFGTIQLPPDGNPIILMADRATAGGYPKIAHVIACDLPKLSQCKPGDKIRFAKSTRKEAEKAYIQREKHRDELKKSIALASL